MATGYPQNVDTFTEPSLAETTPLSSAGDGTRNHVQHHRDLGDAVEALQVEAALRNHDHSGSGDRFHGSKLAQVNTHESADTDSAPEAIHHTLGPDSHQAAPGDHVHDYNGVSIINKPLVLCTSTTRPGAPYPGLMIYETDTNCFRVWGNFGPTEPVTGLDSLDEFDYSSLFTDAHNRPSLNPAEWEQWYSDDPGATNHGAMGVINSGTVRWLDQSNDSNTCIARRIKTADRVTQTDDQVITWRTGTIVIENEPMFTESASNDVYLRMSADRASYIRLQVLYDRVQVLYTTTGPAGEKLLGAMGSLNTNLATTNWMAKIVDRTLTLFRSGEQVGQVIDTKGVALRGMSNRGWGFGMMSGDRYLGQNTPGSIDWIRIQDNVTYIANNRWTVLPIANIPAVRLRQSLRQQLNYTGTLIEWNEELEDAFGFYNPVRRAEIVAKEPGLYDLKSAMQWDADRVPDSVEIVALVNGVETEIRTAAYLRGNGFVPGFSQTVNLAGQIRLKTNDVLAIQVTFVPRNAWLNSIFSFFRESSKIKSRIDLTYVRP
ncbi:hypothetical protein SEA_PUPPER_107 [Gordonia phage Pupper]|uniref:DUF7257 domain-containing protein n=1 Tax=Gordonia phage Pupper TaxID=2571249 RepID=A0A4Y6EIP7_9CAUD|nr:hypothetical protein KHQ83_gp170 [Gordonia phage Pupper]QDF18593.1 hypothetical protein SEA_PUPPER_107 [Gordonia phage Pupper]QDF18825.1 hypothetical protein SEA_SCENTAE_106 [Gordonia phage SCentae]